MGLGPRKQNKQFLRDRSHRSQLCFWRCRWQRDEEQSELELFPQPPPVQSTIFPQTSMNSSSHRGLPWSGTKGCDVSPWERAARPSSQDEI